MAFAGIRGPISYPGGKWKALPQIIPLLPDGIEDWREPFFGGGSVTLGFLQSNKSKDCKRFLVGDLAPEIWAMWKGIQENAGEVANIAIDWFYTRVPHHNELLGMEQTDEQYKFIYDSVIEEGKQLWDWLTKVDCSKLSLSERAARTWVTNRISFSGMGDSGSMSKDQLCSFRREHSTKITDVAPLLQRIEIINASFETTMANVDKDKTFVFLDPPYLQQEKSGLYGKNGDTHHGFPHKGFADFTKALECKWLMTYDDSIKVRKLYRGCNVRPFFIPYTMAGVTAEDALAGEELFIANYEIEDKASFDLIGELV